MKILLRVVGVFVICVVLALVVLRITGFNPIGNTPGAGNYPGLWLSGEVVKTPVTDWSFATQYKTDKVETRTWYMIPHSVTTGFVVRNGQLYITSNFAAGVPFPKGKSWVSNVMRDPHVRVKLGDKLYDCVLTPVEDPDEKAAVLGPRTRRNPEAAASGAPSGPVMHLFHAQSE